MEEDQGQLRIIKIAVEKLVEKRTNNMKREMMLNWMSKKMKEMKGIRQTMGLHQSKK